MADGKVEVGIELDDSGAKRDAERAGRNVGNSYANALSGSIKGLAGKLAGLIAVQEVAQKFVDLTKASVDAYSEYQQLVGGVQKIFDEANQAQILEDANRAYLELNMSANDYLAVINQTGAAFASTMGDQAGYDAARKGMMAISDYASGTGRNLQELSEKFSLITRSTSSYASIADQFSGILPATSEGFLEAAQNAGLLSTEYAKLTEVPIDEYQQAVTEMLALGVEQMGLAGNTAAETASTVSGSLAALTAQWENWLVAVGSGEGLQEATTALVDAIAVAAQNLGPVLTEILTNLKNLFIQGLHALTDELTGNGPEIHARAYELFMKLVDALIEISPHLAVALGMLIVTAIGVLIHAEADFFLQGVELVKSIVSGIGSAIWEVAEEIDQGVDDALAAVKAWGDSFTEAGKNLIQGMVDGVKAGAIGLAEAAADAAGGALQAAKNKLSIQSPSKEFAKVGKWSMEGMEQGIEAGRKSLMSHVNNVALDMLGAATPRFATAGASSSTVNYTFGDVSINASDAYGISAIEELVHLIETA